MAKQYRVSGMTRFSNSIMTALIRSGLAPKDMYMLSTRGRKSGKTYSNPITLIEMDGKRWLVSPYGEVQWVKNVRVARQVTLTRGGKSEALAIRECGPNESAPVLKKYIKLAAITARYFDAKPDDPADKFAVEASRHPVFELIPQ